MSQAGEGGLTIQFEWQKPTALRSWRMIVLTSDCKKACGMSARSVFKSCSMKGMTMKILGQ